MQLFIGLYSTYTKSRFRIMLLIAYSIDANDEILLLAWALVPIENKRWWIWFCNLLSKWFPALQLENSVFMSDREKGLDKALQQVFPRGLSSFCCKYIEGNLTAAYGIKCTSPFWCCVRAKTEEQFLEALKDLYAINAQAGEYIENLDHTLWTR
jgi:hypothetical protein